MNKFWDRDIKPPRGGWIYVAADGRHYEGHSESDIIELLERERRNNGTFVSIVAIEEEIWKYFCGREPARCGQTDPSAPGAVEQITGAVVQAERTPELQGPAIWRFLNTVAASWEEALDPYFRATVNAIAVILTCPICQHEWREIVRAKPLSQIPRTRLAVCQWVNWAHNEVNIKKQKQIYPYPKMVQEYGAPPA